MLCCGVVRWFGHVVCEERKWDVLWEVGMWRGEGRVPVSSEGSPV